MKITVPLITFSPPHKLLRVKVYEDHCPFKLPPFSVDYRKYLKITVPLSSPPGAEGADMLMKALYQNDEVCLGVRWHYIIKLDPPSSLLLHIYLLHI